MLAKPAPASYQDLQLFTTPEPRMVRDIETLLRDTGVFSCEEIRIGADMVQEAIDRPSSDDYSFLFAYEGNILVAYTCYGPTSFTDGTFDLYWIAVSPAASRKGLGAYILTCTEDLLRETGARIVYAETSGEEPYAAARFFYTRNGFETAAIMKDFYADGHDKVIFAKRLK